MGFGIPRHSLTGAGSAKMTSLQILSLMVFIAFKVAGWSSTRFLDQHGTKNVSLHEWHVCAVPYTSSNLNDLVIAVDALDII